MTTLLNKEIYSEEEDWKAFFARGCSLYTIPYGHTWLILFATLYKTDRFKVINDKLKKLVQSGVQIFPKPMYLFNAFVLTPANKLKVVIIGQDPYFNASRFDGKKCPHAMGLSFSLPDGLAINPSLLNIYKNLKKFGHISEIPKSGNLWYWACQGCLMLNSTLTVEENEPNSHADDWSLTNDMIKYISDYCENIVFVLWGRNAANKADNRNKKDIVIDARHPVIITSHPSGKSADKVMMKNAKENYPAFNEFDFGTAINNALKKFNVSPIMFD